MNAGAALLILQGVCWFWWWDLFTWDDDGNEKADS